MKFENRKIKAKVVFVSFVLFLIFILIYIYLETVVNPLILRCVYAQIDSISTTAVSDGIFNVITSNDVDYSDLVEIKYDQSNNITSITSNANLINYLARELSTQIQIELDNIVGRGVKVPLGAFTGMELFTQFGPMISLRILPIGSVITNFNSSFISAGINQTKHSLYVDANISICLILPTSSKTMSFVTSTLVCENIIVGKVPQIYLGK